MQGQLSRLVVRDRPRPGKAQVAQGGARGRPRPGVEAVARALSTLRRLAAGRPDIGEIEVNPLFVLEHGVIGLDAWWIGV